MDYHLRCSECGRSVAAAPSTLVCPDCTTRQASGGETRGVLEVVLHDLPTRWPAATVGSDAFLRPFLPLAAEVALPPLAAGGTPLLAVERLRSELGMPRLWVKDDTRNPSGSTKDRASALVVAKAAEYGFATVATASTGNAATALAAMCAATGTSAVVLVPAAAPPAKLVQMASYGARLVPVAGSYDDAFELCLACCAALGWYNRNTALNPYTVEGKKTAALEIARQLLPEAPDVVVVPTGDGVILNGLARGFADLVAGGLLPRLPRMIAAQPEGSAAIATAIAAGAERVSPQRGAHSVADSLTVETPRNGSGCLRWIRASGGAAVTVPDDDILAAIPRLAATTGVFAEPAAAAALAGLERALATGLVERSERVVLLVTGTGLKDVAAAARAIRMPEPVEPTLAAVVRALGLD